MEIKIIPNTNGRYGASRDGRIYSFVNNHGKQRPVPIEKKCITNSDGYKKVGISVNGKHRRSYVHRLVALTFIPNPDNLKQVNHKNENKADNRVENLEWCTAKYNINYGTHNSRASIKRSKKVEQLSQFGEVIRTFKSIKEASEYFQCSIPTLRRILVGEKENKYNIRLA